MPLAKNQYMSDVWKDGIFSESCFGLEYSALNNVSSNLPSYQITRSFSALVALALSAAPRFVL